MDTASNHESAASNFASFMRTLNIELSLNPEDRRGFMDFLQIAKAEYERMVTTAPNIIDSILNEFVKQFPNKRNVPEIVAVEHPMTIYKRNTATVDQNEYREIRKLYNMRFGVLDGSSNPNVSKPLTIRNDDELSKIDADLSRLEIV
jgi:GTP1/Obg family GTP-binding protein